MRHRNHHRIITVCYGCGCQSVTFCTENYCKFLFRQQLWIINTTGILTQCHCHSFKSHILNDLHALLWPGYFFVKICPWDLKYGSHAHPGCSSIKWIAASVCQKNSIHMESRCASENCPDICRIHDIFQNCNAAGVSAYLFYRWKLTAFHCTEHASCQCITCHSYKYFIFCCIYWDFRITFQDILCLTLQVFMLNKEGNRFIVCI